MRSCNPCRANWLDGMMVNGKCPKCGRNTQEITTVTPLGMLMDEFSMDIDWPAIERERRFYRLLDRLENIARVNRWEWPRKLWIDARQLYYKCERIAAKFRFPYI